ncbi:MAG: hypothetical protein ACK5YL_01085 [Holosporales bacterium]
MPRPNGRTKITYSALKTLSISTANYATRYNVIEVLTTLMLPSPRDNREFPMAKRKTPLLKNKPLFTKDKKQDAAFLQGHFDISNKDECTRFLSTHPHVVDALNLFPSLAAKVFPNYTSIKINVHAATEDDETNEFEFIQATICVPEANDSQSIEKTLLNLHDRFDEIIFPEYDQLPYEVRKNLNLGVALC